MLRNPKGSGENLRHPLELDELKHVPGRRLTTRRLKYYEFFVFENSYVVAVSAEKY